MQRSFVFILSLILNLTLLGHTAHADEVSTSDVNEAHKTEVCTVVLKSSSHRLRNYVPEKLPIQKPLKSQTLHKLIDSLNAGTINYYSMCWLAPIHK